MCLLYENVYSTLKKYPLTLNGIKTWWCQLLARGGALCICHVFGLQMIFEIQRTSVVTHFMSTVSADHFCPMDRTIWQCFESEFAVHKSFLHLLSLSLFSPPSTSPTPTLLLLLLIPFLMLLPPSGSRLQVPLTAINQTLCVFFFIFFYIYRVLIAR